MRLKTTPRKKRPPCILPPRFDKIYFSISSFWTLKFQFDHYIRLKIQNSIVKILYLFHFLILRFRKFNKVQDCKKLVRKEGQQIGNEYFLIEMATDGWKEETNRVRNAILQTFFLHLPSKLFKLYSKLMPGRTLEISAYDQSTGATHTLTVNEKNHRALVRETNQDYAKVACRLAIKDKHLVIEPVERE